MGRLILADNPLLDEHLVMPAESLVKQVHFLWSLRQRKFDLVVDFMGNPRSALATFATRAPARLGYKSARDWAYTQRLTRESGFDYIVKEKMRMLAPIGLASEDNRLILPWDKAHSRSVIGWIHESSRFEVSKLRVCLSPTHRRINRKWPGAFWAGLAKKLNDEMGASVVWLWGPGEEQEVEQIKNSCETQTFMAPKTTFRELAALIAQCDLFIGNSNGPSHVAVAVNTPSVQLHGPTDAPSWCPMTERHRVVASKEITDITVDGVLSVVRKMITELDLTAEQIRDVIQNDSDVWLCRPVL
jgi:ADP-heptose:LPS heptosyltransferase